MLALYLANFSRPTDTTLWYLLVIQKYYLYWIGNYINNIFVYLELDVNKTNFWFDSNDLLLIHSKTLQMLFILAMNNALYPIHLNRVDRQQNRPNVHTRSQAY